MASRGTATIHPALAPLRLPEFGNIEFGWGLCRNSMCPNFCVLYGTEDGPGSDDLRYQLVREGGKLVKLRCRACTLNIPLYSSASLREIARHFLAESLPFADCPTADCENHGVNAFEYYGRRYLDGRLPYQQAGEHELICNLCEAPFPLGVPIALQDKPKVRRQVKALIHSVAMGRTVSDAYESGIDSYYPRLRRSSARLRDYLAYRNAHLLRPLPGDRRGQQAAKVYTDVFMAPLRSSEDGRAKGLKLRVIVSTVELEGTYYILAAHVYFLPDRTRPGRQCPSLLELEADREISNPLLRRWDALKTLLDVDATLTPEGKPTDKQTPDEGQPGQEIALHYAETAHFLVVDRMLSQFGRRYHYMDTSEELYYSAIVAMRASILKRRAEVVIYQHDKPGRTRRPAPASSQKRRNLSALKRASKEAESAFAERLREEKTLTSRETTDATLRSILWQRARKGAKSDLAEGIWLKFPPDFSTYLDCRTWWFTRRPGDTLEDGAEALLAAAMKSVDSAHASMRRRVNGMARRVGTSGGGKGAGLGLAYYRFDVICAEFWIYLIYFNFRTWRRDGAGAVPRAVPMGLAEEQEGNVAAHDIAWSFRLGVNEATEISSWIKSAA